MRSNPRSSFKIRYLVVLVLLSALAATIGLRNQAHNWFYEPATVSASRTTRLPRLVLWAWERPEKLDHLDSSKTTVAFLAQTIYLRGNRSVVRPRLQPLRVAPDAPLIAVTRIESDHQDRPLLTSEQNFNAVDAIAALAKLPRVVAVQIDFDATKSERAFYQSLIIDLREKLPETTGLTITALASWCQSDNWLEDLPIDEAIPMLFRMGVERNQFLASLSSGKPFRSTKCRNSVGLSTDEPISGLPSVQRVYVFNPRSWSPETTEIVLRKIENEYQAP